MAVGARKLAYPPNDGLREHGDGAVNNSRASRGSESSCHNAKLPISFAANMEGNANSFSILFFSKTLLSRAVSRSCGSRGRLRKIATTS